ncbi:pyruvate kinase [Ferroglobus placidus DSM 10642]|uniref:Pyruvate kinase n=1 Tax=Ferroglobus placidus (strain DSM 10642 / AEDII12DO) TaxID=589924 RepID=D3RWQ1_FERPA|nr:pyruvate kinase [Ferroglobus placidus]ADC64914.1 pyruvate kinase [Ferroglobus placidus DSM 10642]
MRKTKIVATLGPSSESYEVIEKLVQAGMDVARINMAFGSRRYHSKLIEAVREASEEVRRNVAILGDLSGAKLRIGELKKPLTLHRGESVVIVKSESGEDAIPVPHSEFFERVKAGEIIHLADGSIKLRVIEVEKSKVVAEVIEGGVLTSYKGISFPGLCRVGLTKKDIRDLEFLLGKEVELIALSFVTSKEDVLKLKELAEETAVIAKIERREAVENLGEIVKASDGIMIARGDLGVEVSIEEVPVIQKRAIKLANEEGKFAITATQMLKSMVVQKEPTRAEVTDVANAVLDGSDALMLSEETASGNYPVEAVKIMDRIIRRAESIYHYLQERSVRSVTEAIAYSAARISEELKAEAIVVFTRTGSSAIQISRFRPRAKILVVAHDKRTLRKSSIVWGCHPLCSVPPKGNVDELISEAISTAVERKLVKKDSLVVVTSGMPFGEPGTTNTIKVLRVDDVV